jgi:diguanylate cyclase (GGDEF)-like protein
MPELKSPNTSTGSSIGTSSPLTALPPGWTASRSLAASILLWFELLALAIGSAQFAVAREAIVHPTVAIGGLVALLVIAIGVRVTPYFKKHLIQRCIWDTFALFAMAVAFSYATGGVHSPVLALFLLPLTGAAIALGRLGYGVVALLVAAAAIVLGANTPDISIESSSFAVWLIGTLVPAVIATTAIAVLVEQMQGAERYIQDLSATDRLTGLLNRRAFEEILTREHRKSERSGKPYCLLIIDVENIKQLNETLGTNAGNQLLIAVAAAISRSIRASDIAARYGGDEFAVLLIDTDLPIATTVGQRIRSHVYAGTISVANRMIRANVHLGLAGFPKDKNQYKDLLVLADQRMQQDRELHRTTAK